MFSKKFGQLKQWTGEKFGNTTKSEPTEDFRILEQSTDTSRAHNELIFQWLSKYIKTIGKKKTSPIDQTRCLPISSLGQALVTHGHFLGDESSYGKSLIEFGLAAEKIGIEQLEYLSKTTSTYRFQHEALFSVYKEHLVLKKKLNKRRLDYDARLNKIQKAKKDSPKEEEELKTAQAKYEASISDVYGQMVSFTQQEEQLMVSFSTFIEAQYEYHKKATETLGPLVDVFRQRAKQVEDAVPEDVPKALESASEEGWEPIHEKVQAVTLENIKGKENPSVGFHDQPELAPSPVSNTGPVDSGLLASKKVTVHRSKSVNPGYVKTKGLFRVCPLYDFTPETADDLKLVKGTVVHVLEKIDDGWWIGEYNGSVGIFPSNYVAVLDDSKDNKGRMMSEVKEQIKLPQVPLTKPNTQISQEAPKNPNSEAENPSLSNSNSGSTSTSLNFNIKSGVINKTNLRSVPKKSEFSKNIKAPEMGPCNNCGCNDFSPNAFVAGNCNNCFHKH